MNRTESKIKPIPVAEQETILRWYRGDENITVYTCDTLFKAKMDKMCARAPDHYRCVERDKWGGARYEMTMRLLSLRSRNPKGNPNAHFVQRYISDKNTEENQ